MKYAVVDLEMCCVIPKGYRKLGYKFRQETIQIGEILLDEDFEVVDEFNTYVKPEYGCIDSFIENLTGISQKDVANALVLKRHWKLFWIGSQLMMSDAYPGAIQIQSRLSMKPSKRA